MTVGGANKIYQVNFSGELLKGIRIENAKNKDWEDMAMDNKGNIYIGDIGNNNNRRKSLVIYKIDNPEEGDGELKAKKIKYNYPEQKDFPPKKKNLKYDAEAMFYREGHLYIITKNRASPFDGESLIYKVPSKKGEYDAELVTSFIPCKDRYGCRITGADISPSGEKIVLLSYGKLWVFTEFTGDDFTNGKIKFIDLGANTQLESVCFEDENTLLISDELSVATGGNLYRFRLDD